MFYIARRTNYKNEDFSSENWIVISEEGLYQELCKIADSNFSRTSYADSMLQEIKDNPNSVSYGNAGRLFQYIIEE